MVSQSRSSSDRFWGGLSNAFSKRSFMGTLLKFFAFGLVSALPYVVSNLNAVGVRASAGEGFFMVFWLFLSSLAHSMFVGMLFAGSTVWYGLTNFAVLFDPFQFGTVLYLLIAVPALLFTAYQPVSLVFSWFEGDSSRPYNPILVLALALLLMIGFSGAAHTVLDGRTITDQLSLVDPGVVDVPANESVVEPVVVPLMVIDLNEGNTV
jgi:hypothetical protein